MAAARRASKSRVASVRFRERRRLAGAGPPSCQVTTVASRVAGVAEAVLIGVASGVPQDHFGRQVGLEGLQQVVRGHVVGVGPNVLLPDLVEARAGPCPSPLVAPVPEPEIVVRPPVRR